MAKHGTAHYDGSRKSGKILQKARRSEAASDKYGKFGAIGTLFRLLLAGYEYLLVAMGVQQTHVPKVATEERVYAYLRKHQGTLVPVRLGTVALATEYWTSSGAHVSHMPLLSHCGEPTWKTCNQKEVTGNIKNDDPGVHIPMPTPAPAEVHRQTAALWQRLHELGIDHGDERAPNTVWNARLGRLMCIDFDWAQIRAEPARDEAEPTAAKRQRLSYAVV
ncbi:hypothetical protein SPI_05720 [Niveomyces insectorum RCEF 264]|uniref:Protein kinase-like domain protein n=1 Tax=Niveomyces insectorum RCEF 264 TaxID=1081102 RepID=A0A167TH13_9HYPO|nr:hypothetical protein SPI_05720 [Niveomyces insectorum RCEF 264]